MAQTQTDDFRMEKDTLGDVRVPAEALWGAQTQRAVENFPVSGRGLEPAQIRALAQITIADGHPLIVPRVREYLAHEFKVDEAGVIKWAQHWHKLALTALEQNLSSSKDTGTYCHGEQVSMADICVASQAAGAGFFKVDLAPFPTFARIAANCAKIDAFARAHPLKQPGAPAAA